MYISYDLWPGRSSRFPLRGRQLPRSAERRAAWRGQGQRQRRCPACTGVVARSVWCIRWGPGSPGEKQFGADISWPIVKCENIWRAVELSHSVCGSSDAAFRCQYSSNLLLNVRLTDGARTRCAVCGSGHVLSLEHLGPGAVSISRPGPQHDERRLRLVHVPAGENVAQWSSVGLVRTVRRRSRWTAATSASFPYRQTGAPVFHVNKYFLLTYLLVFAGRRSHILRHHQSNK